ncbi:MAG: DinB family protein [Acidobacteria bacterium]|nr:DinB family protein [Acidobacteriota bacterium]MBK8148447.1 DinB family protein [Acidobacteriota bacterium]MBK8813271.1 DinB family protein [Acidobacteriota bacterium]
MESATAKTFNIATGIIGELDHEIATTRKCVERLPAELFDWKPHEKSMTLGRLAGHVVEMVNWVTVTCTTSQLDFAAGDYKPSNATNADELVAELDKLAAEAVEALKNTSDDQMHEPWSLKNGDATYFTMPKIATLRTFCLNHIWHHRGQLTVYMRLNDIPVPSIYGPSADEGQM